MAGMAFYFEENDVDVFSGRRIDLCAWNYAAKIGGIDSLLVVNRTRHQLKTPNRELDFEIVDELPSLQNAAIMTCPWETNDAATLWDFSHDVDWYIFGPASGWRSKFPEGRLITIPQQGIGAAHSIHVASCVMYHRYSALGE